MLTKIITILLIFFSFFCQLKTEQELQYFDLTKALQNPSKVRVLDLTGQKLTTFPREIVQLQELKKLLLRWNRLATLPKKSGNYRICKRCF
ncbi:hypothetical protein LEP1GSC043_2308 [Leptospira weilii str. Ecochallenge]|uniref:Leucine rich repeat protein n=1 Tax=Leptospira weilii str. Ecochallenge TaxID=1049986 RepID=N1U784_9LEPT|nr:hypothetical protein LEP1GSC043_2308 [Leptospira weilii str. Ecochallenge]